MSVRLGEDGTIRLEAACPIEDAEKLQMLILENPGAAVDWTACSQAHTAVIQVLIVADPTLFGPPGGGILWKLVQPAVLKVKG